MPPEIVALIDKPHLLALVLAIGAICGMMVERIATRWDKAKRRAYWQKRRARALYKGIIPFQREKASIPLKGTHERTVFDAAEQLRCVMEAEFKSRPVLNRSERRLLGVIDVALAEHRPGWRAMGRLLG